MSTMNVLIKCIAFLIPIIFVSAGTLMVVSPERFNRVWFSGIWRSSDRDPNRRIVVWGSLLARFVGTVFVCAGALFLWLLSHATFVLGEGSGEKPQIWHGKSGHLVLIAITLVVVGLGLVLRTEDVIELVFRRVFGRVVHTEAMRRLKIRYRIYGIVSIVVGLLQLKSWFDRNG